MTEIVLWVAGVYVVTVYPFIKYIQLIRQDLRDDVKEHPTQGWRLID